MKKVKFKTCLTTVIFIFISISHAESGLFGSRCDFLSEKPSPEWMSPDFKMEGFYTGLGQAGKRDSEEKQRDLSKQNALNNLSRNISVKVKSVFKKEEKSTNEHTVKIIKELITETSARELLREVNVRKQWLDRKNCMLWTLAFISRESVQKAKKEILMKDRFNTIMELYDKGTDTNKSPDINARLQYIDDALMVLDKIDFKYLEEAKSYDYYKEKFERELDKIKKRLEHRQGGVLISARSQSVNLPEKIIDIILSYIESGNKKTDRLQEGCREIEECIQLAREQGFGRFSMIYLTTRAEEQNLGALKGTLTVKQTLYDVTSGKVIKEPVNVSSHIIGWAENDLDWVIAAEKIIKSNKLSSEVIQ